jgi:Ser/Thr protein kinase RdoA (MazF antagonist)
MPEQHWDWMPNDEEVAEAFARLNISATQSKELEGSFNRSFAYCDEAGHRLVLRMRPRWMTEQRLAFEHGLAVHLADRGLPVLRPLPLSAQRTWIQAGEIACEVYPFVAGRPGRPACHDSYLSGRLLGDFHRWGKEFTCDRYEPPHVENQLPPHALQERVGLLRRLAAGEQVEGLRFTGEPSLFDQLWQRWEEVLAHYPQDREAMPCVLRHGDFHLWNLLLSEEAPGHIVALLDLDMVAEGWRSYDLSYALYFLLGQATWGREGSGATGSWTALCREFLRGYLEAGQPPLIDTETAAIPLQVETVAVHFLSHDLLREKDTEGVEGVLRTEYLDLADWLDRNQSELLDVLATTGAA